MPETRRRLRSAVPLLLSASAITAALAPAAGAGQAVPDQAIAAQRAALAAAADQGAGPQSPRDIDSPLGANARGAADAPAPTEMNLCNIHFHESAEHRGGEFTTFAGNGDGKGCGTGCIYDGELSAAELAPYPRGLGDKGHGDLQPGDTIEIHFVHSSADVRPGAGLGACVIEGEAMPKFRVEAVVAVLVAAGGADFRAMAQPGEAGGLHQAVNLPGGLGAPVVYAGSTTGPSYNEKASPFLVTWSVRPKVAKMNIASLAAWLKDNPFAEDHAHGVRNLVVNPKLLSKIGG
ncbi:delta-class carbonic anhydrase [Rhodovulum sp. DZ06]|uniref:delta-class carbonic anhydrase n=1 Tax=Rhodovulum sp. DZ06 TaxID=3425126 RepID=UPI003D35985E